MLNVRQDSDKSVCNGNLKKANYNENNQNSTATYNNDVLFADVEKLLNCENKFNNKILNGNDNTILNDTKNSPKEKNISKEKAWNQDTLQKSDNDLNENNKEYTVGEQPSCLIKPKHCLVKLTDYVGLKYDVKKRRQPHFYRRLHLRKQFTTQQSSFSSSFTETSCDEMDEKHKLRFKDVMFSKKMRKRAFWFIVVFLAALTIRDVVNLVIEYSEYPKRSDMNIRFNESMTMPNITFCMSRAQAWSHFRLNTNETSADFDQQVQNQLANLTTRDAFINAPWDYRTVMDAYNLISALTSMERETTTEGSANTIQKFGKQDRFKELRKTLKTWLKILNDLQINFEEFTQKVGRETLRRSMQRFQRTSYDDEVIRTGVRATWISQMQFCFQPTFDADNFKPIKDQGNFFTMILSHNSEKLQNQQVECMSVDFHGRASSNSRFTGSKGQARDGFNDELCMGMMHETTVEVKARYTMLPNDEEGTECRDQEDGDDSEFDCHARCRKDFIKKICHCTAPTLSYLVNEEELTEYPLCNYTHCNINVQTGNYSDDDCTSKCYRSCDQIRYEIDHETKGKSARPDLTTIYLNWGSFEYLTLKEDWVWSLSSFIAALGGSIGMWLGLSILSLIQGGTYIYKYLTQTVIQKKSRTRRNVSAVQPEGEKQNHEYAINNASDPATDIADPIASNPLKNPFKARV